MLEEDGRLTEATRQELLELCGALAGRASEMLRAVGFEKVTAQLLDDLSLLTVGPQLRGSLNNEIGEQAIKIVFDLIRGIVAHALQLETDTRIELLNSSNRRVVIQFSADPDIKIIEQTSSTAERNLVAIELKGGQDESNAWNRLGEAEKSHQTAKQRDFREFWTIFNVSRLDLAKAKEKSPTTNRFFNLKRISVLGSAESEDFKNQMISLVGIKAA